MKPIPELLTLAEVALREFAGRDPGACLTAGSPEDCAIEVAAEIREALTKLSHQTPAAHDIEIRAQCAHIDDQIRFSGKPYVFGTRVFVRRETRTGDDVFAVLDLEHLEQGWRVFDHK